jgi:hypothetical protein
MAQAAARHQPSSSSSSGSSSGGNVTFVTFPAPFNSLKEEFYKSASLEDMGRLSPLTILGMLQRAMFKPCEAMFANATAVKVCVGMREASATSNFCISGSPPSSCVVSSVQLCMLQSPSLPPAAAGAPPPPPPTTIMTSLL